MVQNRWVEMASEVDTRSLSSIWRCFIATSSYANLHTSYARIGVASASIYHYIAHIAPPHGRRTAMEATLPTSPEEQRDLDAAKAKVAQEYELYFTMARDILRASDESLRHMGQKTREGALKTYTESTLKSVDRIWAAHLKKYPD